MTFLYVRSLLQHAKPSDSRFQRAPRFGVYVCKSPPRPVLVSFCVSEVMSSQPEGTAAASSQEPAGAASQSKPPSPVSQVWANRGLIYAALSSIVGFYTTGPARASWSLPVTVMTAVAQANSRKDVKSGKKINIPRVRKLMDRLEAKPSNLIMAPTEITVKQRGLPGLLREADGKETGSRTIPAEWECHRDAWNESSVSDRVVLYLHGGAYILMGTNTHRPLLTRISKALKCRILSVDYRLAPETAFPGQLHDAVSAYLYLTKDLSVPAANIMVAGDSAGGGLSASFLVYLRDAGLPMVGGAILIVRATFPSSAHAHSRPSSI